jgi:hypothetical protein
MLLNNPISGVGMDSYDDYYRESRGLISAIRTGPNRVANTAHNLPIDLGASGGFPLLLSWLVLQAIAFYVLLRSLKRQESFDATLVVLGALWLSYLAQTLISINQISISVWGWIFTGCLISQLGLFGKKNQKNVETRLKNKNVSNARRNPSQTTLLRPAAAGTAFLIGVLGFFSTFPVYATDKSFRAASLKSDTKLMGELSLGLGGNAWLLSQAIQSFGNAKDPAGAKQFAEEMIQRYPRNIYGWQILNMLENVPPSERNDAFRELRSLDPYNPCFSQDYVPLVLNWFNALSPKQQREVIGFWFLPSLSKYGPLEIPTNWRSVVPEEELSNRIVRFCRD